MPVGTAFTMPPLPSTPQPASPWPEAAETSSDGGEFVAVKTRPVYRKQSSGLGGLLLLAALAAAAAGLAWYLKNGELMKTVLPKMPGGQKRQVIRDDVDAELVRASVPTPEPELPPEPDLPPEPAPERPAEPLAETPAEPPTEPPAEPPLPAAAAEEPEPTENPEAAAADEADAEAIVPLLKKAWAALQDERFDDANDALGQAGDEAMGKEAQDRLAHWQALVTYSKGFADLREIGRAHV